MNIDRRLIGNLSSGMKPPLIPTCLIITPTNCRHHGDGMSPICALFEKVTSRYAVRRSQYRYPAENACFMTWLVESSTDFSGYDDIVFTKARISIFSSLYGIGNLFASQTVHFPAHLSVWFRVEYHTCAVIGTLIKKPHHDQAVQAYIDEDSQKYWRVGHRDTNGKHSRAEE